MVFQNIAILIEFRTAVAGGHPPHLVLLNFCSPIEWDCYSCTLINSLSLPRRELP